MDEILDLSGTGIKTLPKNFYVNTSLNLSNLDTIELPQGLCVAGDLILGNTKIDKFPGVMTIGGNIYVDHDDIPVFTPGLSVGGFIKTPTQTLVTITENGHTIFTDEGVRVVFYNTETLDEKDWQHDDFYFPKVTIYKAFGQKNKYAIKFTENKKTYVFVCSSVKEGFEKVNWQRAINRGIENIFDLDVNVPRTVPELIEIYKLCAGACTSGIKKFLKRQSVDMDAHYSLKEVVAMLERDEYYKGASHIFYKLFKRD